MHKLLRQRQTDGLHESTIIHLNKTLPRLPASLAESWDFFNPLPAILSQLPQLPHLPFLPGKNAGIMVRHGMVRDGDAD